MPRVSHRHGNLSFVKQNVSVGLGTHRQVVRRARVSSLVSIVSDEPGVLRQVWGRQVISCLKKDLVGRVGDILQGIHLPFLMERCSAKLACLQCGLSPCLSALKWL